MQIKLIKNSLSSFMFSSHLNYDPFLGIMQSSLTMYNLDILKIVRKLRTLELTECLEGTCRLLLAASLDLSLDLLRGLPPDQGLLLWRLHLPDDERRLPSRGLGLQSLVLGAGHVTRLDCQHHGVHQVLGGLDEGGGRVKAGDYQLPRHVLDISFDLGGDVQLVAVEGDPLKVGDQVLLGCGLWTLLSNDSELWKTYYFQSCTFDTDHFKVPSPGEFVELGSILRNPLGGIDDIHGGFERASASCEVRHLHHDHAHVLGQHDDVVTLVVPLTHLGVLVSLGDNS